MYKLFLGNEIGIELIAMPDFYSELQDERLTEAAGTHPLAVLVCQNRLASACP